MKTLRLLFLICLAGSHSLQGQPYQITFTGSGSSTIVSSVEVKNLTQGTTLTLSGTDVLELVTMIGLDGMIGSTEEIGLKVYPNPMKDQCLISFENPEAGRVSVEITNLAGQLVIREEACMQPGIQTFSAGGLKQGLYSVRVKTSCKQSTRRLISLCASADQPYVRPLPNSSINLPHAKLYGTIQMQYNAGERLLFKGTSGNYSRVVTLVPTQSQAVDFNFIDCTDGDGNHYPVVTIGTQTWMAENLKTTKYNNGNPIPLVENSAAWQILVTPAYCWYENNYATYGSVYGALYNWYAVSQNNICPSGWHVPTNAEWTNLENYVGGVTDAGGHLKETVTAHWSSPNTGATNSSGFTALPGGARSFSDGHFFDIGLFTTYWSSSADSSPKAFRRMLYYNSKIIDGSSNHVKYGFSVRCLRD